MNVNILSERYACDAINKIFSEHQKVKDFREFWITVMEAQFELGVKIHPSVIDAHRRVVDDVKNHPLKRVACCAPLEKQVVLEHAQKTPAYSELKQGVCAKRFLTYQPRKHQAGRVGYEA